LAICIHQQRKAQPTTLKNKESSAQNLHLVAELLHGPYMSQL